MLSDTVIVLLQFPTENEPLCLPGPPGATIWIGKRIRSKVERKNGTTYVWARRAEWETWLFVNEALRGHYETWTDYFQSETTAYLATNFVRQQ